MPKVKIALAGFGTIGTVLSNFWKEIKKSLKTGQVWKLR